MEISEVPRPTLTGWCWPLLLAVLICFVMLGMPSLDDGPGSRRGCSLLGYDQFIVHSKRVVTPDGVFPAAVEVSDGQIVSVLRKLEVPKRADGGPPVLDYGNLVIMPGLIDTHVHLDEPGRDWEGFESGTRAAAAGGLTALVDMPLNSLPATTTKELLELKKAASWGKLAVDVGFWGGLVPENAENETILDGLLGAGALGLKSFMCPGSDFPMTTINHIKSALPVLAKYGRPILVHGELPPPVEDVRLFANGVDGVPLEARRNYALYLSTKPPSRELEAVRQLVAAAEDTAPGGVSEGAHIHLVHLADGGETLSLIKEAKRKDLDISVETCPHYLAFAAEEIKDGQTSLKCAPPIRGAENREKLWEALMDGSIDMLASDHSPAAPEMIQLESGDFLSAWAGVAGLQFVLPVTWTTGKARGLTLQQISNWWSTSPAKLAKLDRKGTIEFGMDADLVVWDPESSFVVDESYTIHHRYKVNAYAGWSLSGSVKSTFVRGQLVFNEGQHAHKPCGMNLLAR